MLVGMDRYSGAELSGPERAFQSVEATLETPRKSQVGARSYGSDLPLRISSPMNEESEIEIAADLVDAFLWEPELELLDYRLEQATPTGMLRISYRAKFIPSGEIYTRIIEKGERT